MELDFIYHGDNVAFATQGESGVLFLEGSIGESCLDGGLSAIESHPSLTSVLVLWWPARKMPESLRENAQRIINALSEGPRACALVVHANGFSLTTAKVFFAGLELIKKNQTPVKHFASVEASSDWLEQFVTADANDLNRAIRMSLADPEMAHFKERPKSGAVDRPPRFSDGL